MLGSLYNGVAPGAKISFMDMAYGNGGLYVPYVNELYPTHAKAGAKIGTNSWGSPFSGSQYYFGADVDNYLFKNPVFLKYGLKPNMRCDSIVQILCC